MKHDVGTSSNNTESTRSVATSIAVSGSKGDVAQIEVHNKFDSSPNSSRS